jgi:hypothetical protein
MAQRRYTSQFSYSFEQFPVSLMGNWTQSGSAGAFAAKTTQGITLTAVTMGSAGNSISIAFTGGGTAGAEVVSVSGNAISVQIESGVSTVTQVRTAINLSAAAAALVAATGTSASAVSTASALPLLSGTDTVFTKVGGSSLTLTQTGTGVYKLACADAYQALLNANIMLKRSSAVDLMPQIQSVDTSSAKAIYFRMQAAATPTNMASGDVLYIRLDLRNSKS